MAKTVSDTLREALTQVAREAIGNISGEEPQKSKQGGLSSAKGLLAGVGLAAAAPLAKKGVDALRDGSLDEMIADLRERVEAGGSGDSGDDADERPRAERRDADEAQEEPSDERGGDEDGDDERQPSGGPQATGKGRRMPVQQSVDVGVPLETAYNQFTQFEDWPGFIHCATRGTQEDDCAVSFATKIWGKTKEFKASIETQRPDERIKWKVSQGITHAGVVTFHELAPNLTRIEVTLDVQPGSLIEKAARGMRHVKRAVRGDLHRFKAFIEMQEFETGAWRGVIIDGELVEPHDESYDEDREYSELEAEEPSASTDEEDEQAEADNEEQVEDEEPVEEDEPVEDEQPVAESEDEESDEDEGDDQPKRRSKQARGRRSRTVSTNGHGKPERVGSGGGRRRRSATG
jgi:uncharacterized membrane protein/ribosomal protein L12E/L44/L45/RPP1/RPP2